jgi:hypothetical protein
VEISHLPTSSAASGTLVLYVDGMRQIIRLSRKPCFLPLAPIVGPGFDYEVLLHLFEELQPPEELAMMVRWMTTEDLAGALSEHPRLGEKQKEVTRNRTIFEALPQLLAQGTMCEGHARFSQPLFLVPKSDGVSSRLIADCRDINDIIKDTVVVPPMPLPRLQTVVDEVLAHSHVASIDATSMFYQFTMHPSLATFFGARVGGTRGAFKQVCLNVLPMGCVFAPSFAQFLSNYLCDVVMSRVGGKIIAWVDNYILMANSEQELRHMQSVFVDMCRSLTFTMKDYVLGPEIQLLGIDFDLELHQASPTKASLENAKRSLAKATSTGAMDHEAFMTWFGTVLWINHATMRTPLCFFHEVMEQLRSIARKGDWKGRSAIVGSTLKQMHALHRAACSAVWKLQPTRTVQQSLWTDASTIGMGAVVTQLAEVLETWSWEGQLPQRAIFCAELLAGHLGAKAIVPDETSFEWITDNDAASRAMRRGHSSSRLGDKILEHWIGRGPPTMVTLVPSACNISDPLSRGINGVGPFCAHSHPTAICRWRPPRRH